MTSFCDEQNPYLSSDDIEIRLIGIHTLEEVLDAVSSPKHIIALTSDTFPPLFKLILQSITTAKHILFDYFLIIFSQLYIRTSETNYTTLVFQGITEYLSKTLTFLLRVIAYHSDYLDAYQLLGKFFPLRISQFQSSLAEAEFYRSPDQNLSFCVQSLGIEIIDDEYYNGLYLQLLFVAILKQEKFLDTVKSLIKRLSSDHPDSLQPTLPQMKGILKALRTVSFLFVIFFMHSCCRFLSSAKRRNIQL